MDEQRGTKAVRRAKLRQRSLYSLYLRLDRRRKPPNHPLDTSDGAGLLAGIESITVEPIGSKFVHRFPQDALDKIRSKNLDVLIRFGFNILHGVHTYNRVGNVELIDGARMTPLKNLLP